MTVGRIIAVVAVVGLASAAVAASVVEIDQVGQKFSQRALNVAVSDIVRFVNHDDVTHNISVTDEKDAHTDKGLQKPGETIVHTFDKAGKFSVHCLIHPKMKMTVTVQ